jgi:hypothetical protein
MCQSASVVGECACACGNTLRNTLRSWLLISVASLCWGQKSPRPEVVRTVVPERSREPKLEEAIRRELGDDSYSYAYNRVSLNGESSHEALVYLPGRDYCGTGGCTSLIFEFRGGEYRLVSRLTLTRPPVMVSSHRTNGWNDLVVFVSGGGVQQEYYAVLSYDGARYPENPTVPPAAPLKTRVRCVAYLAGAGKPETDIVVAPR